MRIKIDTKAWMQKGIAFQKVGDTFRFMLPKRSDVIEARDVGSEIELFPERSAAHKALVAALA